MTTSHVDRVIAIPTLVGSICSFVSCGVVLALHVALPPGRHFRHALIVNLLVADFINSCNNTISGIIIIAKGSKPPTAPADANCVANAWIGQFSVQAVDFNILIISIIVFCTVFRSRRDFLPTRWQVGLVCASAWVPGLVTSNVALGLDAYGYVGGNWCWIKPSKLGLRYALTHGWRIAIFIATITLYTCIYIRLKRVFNRVILTRPTTSTRHRSQLTATIDHQAQDTQEILASDSFTESYDLDSYSNHSLVPQGPSDDMATMTRSSRNPGPKPYWPVQDPPANPPTPATTTRFSSMPVPPDIRKIVFLNGYPIVYIILWIPGIANRIAESRGGSPRWLTALQASTQFVGLANALTYGFGDQMRRKIWPRNTV
ncbi:Glucose receptor Git3 [Metarhizium album ARSEF 1941]|uniref:Glucose receptor Git3 n=1 Tax=Metarhizium album (strain ARSEF 1941) TaxID=1081103 RepID=A0A0B2WK21_METAS|nr:Glucose receptor Git3 [Metarhizium album ARSEF 1941]KHN94049.1 Glucose receptor Git3 [Metarhizium album ARSEF 1941]